MLAERVPCPEDAGAVGARVAGMLYVLRATEQHRGSNAVRSNAVQLQQNP